VSEPKDDIVCISTIDWDFVWQGHQEIMSTFARAGHRVLFIENTGVRRPTLKDLPRIRKRIANWRAGIYGIRRLMDNLYVYSPLVLPFPYSRVARFINRLIMVMTLRSWGKTMHFQSPIIWTWLPTALALDLIKALNGKLVIYYCFDNFEAISRTARKVRETERVLIRNADLVFVTARHLFDYCARFSTDVHLFPSGFSERVFACSTCNPPADLAEIKRPIIGYIGGVHKAIDFELLEKVAQAHSDKSLVLVGPLQADVGSLARYNNVFFLGQKKHEELPDYIACFAVCLIPYVLNEYTQNVYPTKLNEYLIMGKPVVATRLPELEYFDQVNPGIVSVAANEDGFLLSIETAITNDSEEAMGRRMQVAAENSWGKKIERMTALIEAKLEEKRKITEQSWQTRLTTAYAVTRRKVFAASTVLLLAYVLLFYTPVVWWAAKPLRIADQLAQADVIVVLAGGIGESSEPSEAYQEKVKHAVELYQQAYASHLLLSSGVSYVFQEAGVMQALAVSMGVPMSAIILDDRGGGNYFTLLHVKQIMESHGWTSMLLVTSRYNTTRSRLVVEKNLPHIRVRFTPPPQSVFFGEEGRVAWQHLRSIIHEYLSIVYYWMKGYI